jgi:hypothetical protein
MALRGRRIKYFFELWWLVGSGGFTIWVSSTSFQKSSISWPQQPPTEKVLKFKVIFPDSTQNSFFQNIQIKLNLMTWITQKSAVVIFQALESLQPPWPQQPQQPQWHQWPRQPHFIKKNYWSWWLDHSWYQNDQYTSLFVEWIFKNPIFH